MLRDLDTATLANAARDYAGQFLLPTMASPHDAGFAPISGRGWVMNSMYNFHFKDEFDYLLGEIKKHLGPTAQSEFEALAAKTFSPRSDDVFHALLAEKLAVTPDGKPIHGKIGTVKQGQVVVGWRINKKGRIRLVKADIHAGESEAEAIVRVTDLHQSHGEVIFPITQLPATMALNTRLSNEIALLMCNACVDNLDEGSAAAIIQGRSGAQPADPDTASSGTLYSPWYARTRHSAMRPTQIPADAPRRAPSPTTARPMRRAPSAIAAPARRTTGRLRWTILSTARPAPAAPTSPSTRSPSSAAPRSA